MEVIIVALLILFVILIITLGIENTFSILLPVSFLGIAIYLLGQFIKYFLPVILILFFVIFIIGIIKKKSRSSTYKKTKSSSSSNRTTYGRFNSREEVEEFFRTFFGEGFGQGSTGTDDDFFNSGSNSNSTNRTYYGGFNSREEAEEFFRTFFGGGFGQGSTGTGGNTYGGGYSNQNNGSSYQRNTYNSYTTDKSKYYTILGVNKNASQDEIKKAYHKLAKQHHPDRFVNSSESEKKYHESKMKEINDAYENLTK